ncbi:MAG: type II toxin-antitoxin system prevent-host-death family antitoxin [Patescibacteria group bacterium]
MGNIVGLKDLRQNMADYAKKVQKGRSFIIVKQSKPLFRIAPISEEKEEWQEVIDFTKLRKGGVEIKEILSRL